MYAIIKSGGKQYRVSPGANIRLERLPGEVGDEVTIDNVLFVSDGDKADVGSPAVEGARVTARIIEQGRAKKVRVFKIKRRKRYRRHAGHRQRFTEVKITSIDAPGFQP